eukprot:1298971-Pleurochrysis_carterae.AAC.1
MRKKAAGETELVKAPGAEMGTRARGAWGASARGGVRGSRQRATRSVVPACAHARMSARAVTEHSRARA